MITRNSKKVNSFKACGLCHILLGGRGGVQQVCKLLSQQSHVTIATATPAATCTPINRYAYTLNNPTRFTDPSGHVCYNPITDAATSGCTQPSPQQLAGVLVSFQVVENVDDVWTSVEKAVIYQAAYDVGKAFANNINARMRTRMAQVGETYQDITLQEAFLQVYGGAVTFTKTGQSCKEATGATLCYAETQSSRSIHVFNDIYNSKGQSLTRY